MFSALGAGIAAPDDGVFGFDGTFFATEPMNATVSARNPDGTYRTLRDDLPGINGITMDPDRRRLFADEFRPGGRLWELDPAGERPPTLLADDLFTPNALAVGPDAGCGSPRSSQARSGATTSTTGRCGASTPTWPRRSR